MNQTMAFHRLMKTFFGLTKLFPDLVHKVRKVSQGRKDHKVLAVIRVQLDLKALMEQMELKVLKERKATRVLAVIKVHKATMAHKAHKV